MSETATRAGTVASTLAVSAEQATAYVRDGWWRTDTVGDIVTANAAANPAGRAFTEGHTHLSWSELDRIAWVIAARLVERGIAPRSRVAVMMPDGPLVHAVYVGVERAGAI
ncbi:MAG TPA: AMP-binding protein, partial [Ilumatobacteraceae bacterium]|nr:AMP-binding protein [Ilumatobacteraceae bacterium]